MQLIFKMFDMLNPEITAWAVAAIIVIHEFRHLKRLFVYLLMKLYKFFIQHNTGSF